jgi:hypothetical protein
MRIMTARPHVAQPRPPFPVFVMELSHNRGTPSTVLAEGWGLEPDTDAAEGGTVDGRTLVGALVVGLAVGAVGRLVVPGRTAAPVWLTLALGVAAALLGAIVVGLVDTEPAGPAVWQLVVESGFAAAAVVLAVLAAGRPASGKESPPRAGARREEGS